MSNPNRIVWKAVLLWGVLIGLWRTAMFQVNYQVYAGQDNTANVVIWGLTQLGTAALVLGLILAVRKQVRPMSMYAALIHTLMAGFVAGLTAVPHEVWFNKYAHPTYALEQAEFQLAEWQKQKGNPNLTEENWQKTDEGFRQMRDTIKATPTDVGTITMKTVSSTLLAVSLFGLLLGFLFRTSAAVEVAPGSAPKEEEAPSV